MKACMHTHVANERFRMFQASANNVRDRLNVMVKDVRELMSDKTDEVFTQMRRDYRSMVGGGNIPQDGQVIPREQRLVRKEIMSIVKGVERIFMKVAGEEVVDEDHQNDDDLEEGLREDCAKAEAATPSYPGGNATDIDLVKKEIGLDQNGERSTSPATRYGDAVLDGESTAEATIKHRNEADPQPQGIRADSFSDGGADTDGVVKPESDGSDTD